MKATRNWKLKDWLEAGAYAVAILGALAGALLFLGNARSNAIDKNRSTLVRAWTNEGDVLSKETRFIDLVLEDHDGDVIGTIASPRLDQPLDVHADVGWFSTKLTITQLRGRVIAPVATVQVKITGNDNRLSWQAIDFQVPEYLPRATTLWPHPLGTPQ
jgi:hypothetical protein